MYNKHKESFPSKSDQVQKSSSRSMATVTQDISTTLSTHAQYLAPIPEHIRPSSVLATVYSFPRMEPLHFTRYPSNHLYLPLRRDILHRAVVHEADCARAGTASTKWRREVRGSTRKILPQKGTGKARAGDKKSPIRKGGGVAHGPKPRDFSTGLQRKVYDLAWRTALSYRYRRGQLILIEDEIDRQRKEMEEIENGEAAREGFEWGWVTRRYLREIFEVNGWKGDGKTTVFMKDIPEQLSSAFEWEENKSMGKVMSEEKIQIRYLLTGARVVMEKGILDRIFEKRHSDLTKTARKVGPIQTSSESLITAQYPETPESAAEDEADLEGIEEVDEEVMQEAIAALERLEEEAIATEAEQRS
jgi:large subunit ribosomal protein L4